MNPKSIEASWYQLLEPEFQKPYFTELQKKVSEAYQTQTVFPKQEDIFAAFRHTPVEQVKVVLIGQDPYHGIGQAHGLSFSVTAGIKLPPSLKNIYKALHQDLGIAPATHGDLTQWATQGVLLLNATLTVKAHKAGSHQNWGWETFTDEVIRQISKEKQQLVFLLWGSFAQKKASLIFPNQHLVLKAAHPSPLSAYRGFFDCQHFSKTNEWLHKIGKKPIDWEIKP